MYLAEAVPPVGPIFVPAMAALFTLCALIFAIGMVKLVDKVSRAFFGTVSGAVGWIPFAGKLVTHSLHKIEQKISHVLGNAERSLDGYVALTWHNMARLVHLLATEIAGTAQSVWRLAQQAENFVRRREVTHEVRTAVKPVNARAHAAQVTARHARAETKALHHSVTQGVYPRLKVGENERAHVLNPGVASARATARAAEDAAVASYKYLVHHRRSVIAGVFTGAVAWALTRVGAGWVRCANWKKIGRRICRLPMPVVDALLAALLAELALAHLHTLAEFAQNVTEEATRGIADLLGVVDLPSSRFTIE
jgi:hypothetical protein